MTDAMAKVEPMPPNEVPRPSPEKIFPVSWDQFHRDSRALAWRLSGGGRAFEAIVCITRGGNGSLLVTHTSYNEHPGFSVKIADTVGAGDAFTAALVHHFLRGAPLSAMNEAANRMGAWLAARPGATPEADPAVLEKVRSAHQ